MILRTAFAENGRAVTVPAFSVGKGEKGQEEKGNESAL